MPEVYAGKKELALDSQLYFLTSRFDQLGRDTMEPNRIAISDYVFNKEQIYAERLLNSQQLDKYKENYNTLQTNIVQPVLVIYLQDLSKSCLERIHERGRPYEQKIGLQFLEAIRSDYEELFAGWKICPVIRISMSEFDCTRNGDIEHLTNQVKYYVTT